MRPLPEVKPLTSTKHPPVFVTDRLEPEDFRSLLAGLTPGRYTTGMLFPRYRVWAQNAGRPEVHPRAFGKYMRAFVGEENTFAQRKSGGTRIFTLTADHVSGPQSPIVPEEKANA